MLGRGVTLGSLARPGVLAIAALLLHCGGGAASPLQQMQPNGGASGTGGAGVAQAGMTMSTGGTAGTGGGAGGGSAATTLTLVEACVAYNVAICERDNTCLGTMQDCSPELQEPDCWGRYSAPGSVRTASTLVDCAKVWRQHPCELVVAGIPPECALPGTRKGGEACLWGNQCDSLRCISTGPHPEYPSFSACGTCEHQFGPDEDCSGEGACPVDESCDLVTLRCKPYEPPSAATLPGDGAACEHDCAPGFTCLADVLNGPGTCAKLPAAGKACKYIRGSGFGIPRCASGSYCNEASLCVASPVAPEACGVEYGANTWACQRGNYCALGDVKQCKPLPSAGQPCVRALQQFEGYVESSLDSAELTCALGLQCQCDDASCAAGTCTHTVAAGAACDGVSRRCVPGSNCVGGKCVQVKEVFEALCGAP